MPRRTARSIPHRASPKPKAPAPGVDADGKPIYYHLDGTVDTNKRNRRYAPKRPKNKSFLDLDPELKPTHTLGVPIYNPPYFTDLQRRLITYVDNKRNPELNPGAGMSARGRRFSLQRLASKSGVCYWTLVAIFIRRKATAVTPAILDSILYGMGLNVIDLMLPSELAQRYAEVCPGQYSDILSKLRAKAKAQIALELAAEAEADDDDDDPELGETP